MIFLMTPNPPPAFAAPDLGSLAWPPSFKEGTLFLFGRSNISGNDILTMAIKQGLVGAVVVATGRVFVAGGGAARSY